MTLRGVIPGANAEGQASEETMNEAVRCRGTVFQKPLLNARMLR